MVNGVVDGLDDLALPLILALHSIEHVVDVDCPVEGGGPQPLEEHRVGVLASEIHDDRPPGGHHIRAHQQRLARLALVLQRVRAEPDLVLRIRFCEGKRRSGQAKNLEKLIA